MEPFKILVAVDFSDDSDYALAEAIRLAARASATLELVHVCNPRPVMPSEVVAAEPMDTGDVERARSALHDLRDRVASQGLEANTHLAVGTVIYGLIDTIKEVKPDMVVVGSHGKGALKRALLGSVSETLARRSPAPVLVVPSPRRAHEGEHAPAHV